MYIGVCHMYWSAETNLWGVELNLLEFEMQETSATILSDILLQTKRWDYY